ncbi:MAG: ATP-binding protein, partial [Candidatus Omnitrophica bacterium]|nr:ATP-binding protein [Candidatus Omnitrophota bacterium]
FNPNSVVSTNLFAGRKDYVLKILRKLEQVKNGMPASFFLYGERGIGKTALAKLIMHIAEAKDPVLENLNFLTSYYSVDKGQNISAVLQASLNELTDRVSPNILSALGERLGYLLKNGKFTIGAFSVDMRSTEEKNIVVRDQLISILSNLIEAIKKEDEDKKRDSVLIVIDEMQNISDVTKCAQLLRGIVTTLDVKSLGNIGFLLMGYESVVKDFFDGDPSARRQFDPIELGVMPVDEAKEVLTKGFKEAEVLWDQAALDSNILATGGYPHSIQLLGHNLLEVDGDNQIDGFDWDKAIHRTAAELQSKDFSGMYNFHGKTSAIERILDVLAVAWQPLSKQEIMKYAEIKNVYQYLPELKKRGSIKIDADTGNLFLHSRLFGIAILLKIMDKVKKENYLSLLIEEKVLNGKNA